MVISDFFNITALVEKQVNTKTSMGGVKKNWATRIASVPGRLDIDMRNRDSREAGEFGKMTVRRISTFFCDASTANQAIDEGDRLTISSRIYLVTGIGHPALLNRHLEIEVEEIK